MTADLYLNNIIPIRVIIVICQMSDSVHKNDFNCFNLSLTSDPPWLQTGAVIMAGMLILLQNVLYLYKRKNERQKAGSDSVFKLYNDDEYNSPVLIQAPV